MFISHFSYACFRLCTFYFLSQQHMVNNNKRASILEVFFSIHLSFFPLIDPSNLALFSFCHLYWWRRNFFCSHIAFSCQNLSHLAHGKIRTFPLINGRMNGKAITLTSSTVKKLPMFYPSWSFTGVFTKARHWCLSWVTFRCLGPSK